MDINYLKSWDNFDYNFSKVFTLYIYEQLRYFINKSQYWIDSSWISKVLKIDNIHKIPWKEVSSRLGLQELWLTHIICHLGKIWLKPNLDFGRTSINQVQIKYKSNISIENITSLRLVSINFEITSIPLLFHKFSIKFIMLFKLKTSRSKYLNEIFKIISTSCEVSKLYIQLADRKKFYWSSGANIFYWAIQTQPEFYHSTKQACYQFKLNVCFQRTSICPLKQISYDNLRFSAPSSNQKQSLIAKQYKKIEKLQAIWSSRFEKNFILQKDTT